MRILHIIQELGRGGAERSTATLVDGAKAAGHEVAVVAAAGSFGDAFAIPIFPMPFVERWPHRLPLAALAVRRATLAWRPDVIHCHNPTMALATGLAMGRKRGLPTFVTVHGVADKDYRLTSRILRWLPMPTVACGSGVAAALREHGLHPLTIQNGVSPAPPAAARADLERLLPTSGHAKLFLAAGRLATVKNFGLLIRAFAHLPDAALVIAGEGPLRAELEREIVRCGVQSRVALVGYRLDARALMGAADGIVITSNWEGLPLVSLEALMDACPIVATRARWQSEVLTHEHDCLLVEPNDPLALAGSIRRLMDEPDLAARLSANARLLSLSYTEAGTLAEYLALYRNFAHRELAWPFLPSAAC